MNKCLAEHPEAVIEHNGFCWCSLCGCALRYPDSALISADELHNPNNPFVKPRNAAIKIKQQLEAATAEAREQKEREASQLRAAMNSLPTQTIPGYIYFAINAAMPDLVKIGMTAKWLHERMSELHTTGVPVPFQIGACYAVCSPAACEAELHQLLHKHRVSPQREFFRIPLNEALLLTHPILMRYVVHSVSV